jgi:hypothetical protein
MDSRVRGLSAKGLSMGYTHYWDAPTAHLDYAAVWPGIITDTRKIITAVRAAGIVIAGPAGRRRPQLDAGGIALNGDATSDLDCESFILAPPGLAPSVGHSFCKTERRPYDLAVAAVLLRCHLLLPGTFRIWSDGGWDREWLHGVIPPAPDARHLVPSPRRLVADVFGPVSEASPLRRATWQG